MSSTPTAFPVGRTLFRVTDDGRRAIVETWEVTQHRVAVLRGSFLTKEEKARQPKNAHLRRIDPPAPVIGGTPLFVKRQHVPLEAPLKDTEFAASISAAAKKALARAERDLARWRGYLDDPEIPEDEKMEIQQDIRTLEASIRAIKKLF